MRIAGKRLTKEGVIVIVAQQHRTQERNRADARDRLFAMIRQAAVRPTPRRPDESAQGPTPRKAGVQKAPCRHQKPAPEQAGMG
jgi:ribosome-associated protein